LPVASSQHNWPAHVGLYDCHSIQIAAPSKQPSRQSAVVVIPMWNSAPFTCTSCLATYDSKHGGPEILQ